MPIRKRSSVRAVAAAAICVTSLTALGAGPASAVRADGPAPSASPQRDTQPERTDSQSTAPTQQQSAKHTVVPGDTLWDIAQQTLGNPLLWEEIYTPNQQTIEDAARRHGFASSDRGHWIFPGTVLTLPPKANPPKAPDETVRTKANGSPAARAALARLQQNIRNYVAQNTGVYSFLNLLAAGRVVLITDAPANVVSQLTNLSGAPESEVQAIRNILVIRGTVDLTSRDADEPPFKGGGGIQAGTSGCTAGYAVSDHVGARFMVTAGHCFDHEGEEVTTLSGRPYGRVYDKEAALDAARISGESYAGRIFTGDRDSDTIPVLGAGDPRALPEGFAMYCFSGLTTGESCGNSVVSTGDQLCPKDPGFGCVEGVTTLYGIRGSRHGDSGAPLYVKGNGGAFIRGHILAGTATEVPIPGTGLSVPGFVSVALPWSQVANKFGVNIVTGLEGVDMVPNSAGTTG
ncbi:LysM peptidoglycan-binding domain-containing protein [Streptomyces sp. NPDC006332]|uniref:LysM peptidoglycan-binding domain-containing protein n=1 Tax=Streptomyces sp. NPDC006332 TaxID=3155456 RepID=UPI0033A11AD4